MRWSFGKFPLETYCKNELKKSAVAAHFRQTGNTLKPATIQLPMQSFGECKTLTEQKPCRV